MVNFSILISNLETSGPGGLFDIGATLPLVAIQFLLLMVILNILLYSPLLKIITERNEFILANLSKASQTLTKASELTTQYETELSRVRKEAQSEIANSQKIHKEILDNEINISQKSIDNLLDNITKEFFDKKEKILNNLDNEINTLSSQIENKLSI